MMRLKKLIYKIINNHIFLRKDFKIIIGKNYGFFWKIEMQDIERALNIKLGLKEVDAYFNKKFKIDENLYVNIKGKKDVSFMYQNCHASYEGYIRVTEEYRLNKNRS